MSSEQQAQDKNVWCRNLRLERERLGLTQEDVALHVGVTSKTVGRWEASIPVPADKLALLAGSGWDVLYVLTGLRESAGSVADTGSRYPARDPLCDQIQRLPARERDALKVLLGYVLGSENE